MRVTQLRMPRDDVEPHDPDIELVDDRLSTTTYTSKSMKKSGHDADSNPCFDKAQKTIQTTSQNRGSTL